MRKQDQQVLGPYRPVNMLTAIITKPWLLYAWRMLRANLIGAICVIIISSLTIPYSKGKQFHLLYGTQLIVFISYLIFATVIITIYTFIRIKPIILWQIKDGAKDNIKDNHASLLIQQRILTLPLYQTNAIALCWICGSIMLSTHIFSLTNMRSVFYASVNILGGIISCTICYLQAERTLSQLRTRALVDTIPPSSKLGIPTRIFLIWGISNGIPLGAVIVLVTCKFFAIIDVPTDSLLIIIGLLSLVSLLVGLLLSIRIAIAIDHPLDSLHTYLRNLQEGNYNAKLAINDLTGIGTIQAELHTVAHDLAEKELLSDLFNRYVGEKVAQKAIAEGTSLGGIERQVAIVFIDIINSTGLSHQYDPQEIVTILNSFFRIVVDITTAFGALVNKFIGDAALIVFNAPEEQENYPSKALTMSRALAAQIHKKLPNISVGIGVSCGPAIAGLIGAQERFEYTVTGDAVNEASRLMELAKNDTAHNNVYASQTITNLATSQEQAQWAIGKTVILRGRNKTTTIMYPLSNTHTNITDAHRNNNFTETKTAL